MGNKKLFIKFEGRIFKKVLTSDKVLGFIWDKSRKDWRKISGGALTEVEMYGREIEKPKINKKSKN